MVGIRYDSVRVLGWFVHRVCVLNRSLVRMKEHGFRRVWDHQSAKSAAKSSSRAQIKKGGVSVRRDADRRFGGGCSG